MKLSTVVFLVTYLYEIYSIDLKAHQLCMPGTIFKIDCDTCRCKNDGLSYKCSRPAQDSHQLCTPGTVFRIDCDTCRCKYDGSSYNCYMPTQDSSKCTPGTFFKENEKACNTCFCGENSDIICNLVGCPPDLLTAID